MISSPADSVRLEDTLFEFTELKLEMNDFNLGGLGESAENCGKLVMTDIDITAEENDIRAVRFKPLRCQRIECPSCYHEWAMRRAFEIALRIEAMAKIRGERPFHVIFSIHPNRCAGLTWTDINQRLWRRGKRRLGYVRCSAYYSSVGNRKKIKHSVADCPDCLNLSSDRYGGIGIFHPFRIRKKWQLRLGGLDDENLDGSASAWKKIRERLAADTGKLADYVEVGYHTHNLVFTDYPERHKDKEYLIKFAGNFERLSRKRVIALVRYLVTHTATIRETVAYQNHTCGYCGHSYLADKYRCNHCGRVGQIVESHAARNRIVHPIRSWGILHNFDPKEALIEKFGEERGLEIYHSIAREIANSLYVRNENGELITMTWNEDTEELEYPAFTVEFLTSSEKTNWVSIYKLLDLLNDSEFTGGLSPEKLDFAQSVVDYVFEKGIPPPIEDCGRDPNADGIYIPDSISVVIPICVAHNFDLELEHSRLSRESDRNDLVGAGLLRQKIIDLLAAGEDDIFKLDICLPEYKLGQIMRVLDWLSERGEIIMLGELVELNYPVPTATTQRQVSLAAGGGEG